MLADIKFHALAPFLVAKSLINLSHTCKLAYKKIDNSIPLISREKYGYFITKEEFFAKYKYYSFVDLPFSLYGINNSDIAKMKIIIADHEKYTILCKTNNKLMKSNSSLAQFAEIIDQNIFQLFDEIEIVIKRKENYEFSIDVDNKCVFVVYNNNNFDGIGVDWCENMEKFCNKYETSSSILINFIKEIFFDDNEYDSCFRYWKTVR